ncbi:MAG: ABC transporter ATP-binding protein [Acidimicrobiia bacterium]|nr:ABC transporter ATP-binding protein [Acidimicrobiia bacterium]
MAISLSNVTVSFGDFDAVDDLTAEIPAGQWVGLIGPNGAGKTSLLRAVLGLLPHSGRISLDGTDHAALTRRDLSRQVALVPQTPVCPPEMAVADYVLLGRTPYISYLGTETVHDIEVVAAIIDRLDLGHFVRRPLRTLSGGELQRVVLARALAQQAPVLLLDEPTSALDVGHQQQVLELVDELCRHDGLTVVAAMHDLTLAGQFADRLLLMSNGRSVAMGPPADVLTEHTISEHYGASVRVLRDECGGVVVVPTRAHTRGSADTGLTDDTGLADEASADARG